MGKEEPQRDKIEGFFYQDELIWGPFWVQLFHARNYLITRMTTFAQVLTKGEPVRAPGGSGIASRGPSWTQKDGI